MGIIILIVGLGVFGWLAYFAACGIGRLCFGPRPPVKRKFMEP